MPKLPKAPSIPKPFQRPGIDISGTITRSWQETPYDRIRSGDIIPDFGKVESVELLHQGDPFALTNGLMLRAVNVMGVTKRWTGTIDYISEVKPKLPTIYAFSEG